MDMSESQPEPLRILVAEDEAIIRLDLSEMLRDEGYEVIAAVGDGKQAVERARELRPDVIVMDVKMPALDGITAAEQIAADSIAPIVMLTAFSDKELVERASEAGVMAYVLKPFTAADLRPAITVARSRFAERQALAEEIKDLGERFETRKRLDRAKGILMKRLGIEESEAFRWIQKTAMDRRMGMRDVADAVIDGMGQD